MLEAKIKMTGTRPLMMHNVRLASPMDPYAKQLKVLSSKKKKTEADYIDMARVEFEGGLYLNDDGPFIPDTWLLATLCKASFRTSKIAKATMQAAVIFTEQEVSISYDGPRDVDGLWGEGIGSQFVDVRSVKVGQARVDRTRPVFPEWEIQTVALVDPLALDMSQFCDIFDAAQFAGIGEYRPVFGRFTVEVE